MADSTQAAKRKTVDWEAVSLRYRTGTESLRTIAADFGITEGAIRQRAKKEDWTRDLSDRVKQATDAALLRKGTTQDVRTEGRAIKVAAEMRSDVVLRHRGYIGKSLRITESMLEELERECAKKNPELLAKRAPVLKQLAEALRIQVNLERQAFGMTGEEGDMPEHVANAAAAAAAGAVTASNGRTFTDTERAVRLVRLLQAGQIPAAPAAEAPPA
jgi:hypothetical protein